MLSKQLVRTGFRSSLFLFVICIFVDNGVAGPTDIALDAKAALNHRLDSLNLLLYMCLLTLTVLTIWLFKHHRVSWLHPVGLAVIYGKGASLLLMRMAPRNSHHLIDLFAKNESPQQKQT